MTPEDKKKMGALQAEHGEDCAFFEFPIGLTCFAAPAEVSKAFWDLQKGMSAKVQDPQTLLASFALKFVAHPDRDTVAAFFGRKPGAAVNASLACRRLAGEFAEKNPVLPEDSTYLPDLERLRKEHDGDVAHYVVPGFGLVVLACPSNPASYRQYFKDISNDVEQENPDDVFVTFALDCVVFPSRDRADSLFHRKPGLAKEFARAGQLLAGGEYTELGKA